MLIKDLEPYIVFDIINIMEVNNISDENDLINKFNKVHKGNFILVYTYFKSFYFIIHSNKLKYSNIRLKVFADFKYLRVLKNRKNVDNTKASILSLNNDIKNIVLRYVNIEKKSISKLTEVKTILKSLDFNDKEYLCEYFNGKESIWYELYEDGLYLNGVIIYSTLNNKSVRKADFNKITCIQEVKNLYTYELENK